MELRDHVTTERESAIEQAGLKAARKYLEHVGYVILASEYQTPTGYIDLVATRDTTIVFITIFIATHRMPAVRTIDEESRLLLERKAMFWLADNRESAFDVSVTFDIVSVGLICRGDGDVPDRALIRHNRDILATPYDQERPTDPEGGLSVGEILGQYRGHYDSDPYNPPDGDVIDLDDVEDPDGELIRPDDLPFDVD